MKESELERVLASPNNETLDQLCDLLMLKLAEKQKGGLLPKQGVASSNLVTRSISYKGGTCLPKIAVEKFISKYRLYAKAQGLSYKTISHVSRCVRYFYTFMGGIQDVSLVTASDFRRFKVKLSAHKLRYTFLTGHT